MIANRDNELAGRDRDDHEAREQRLESRHTVVGVFDSARDLERGYAALLQDGFDPNQIALASRGTDAADEIANQDASDRAAAKAAGGAAIGGVSGGALALLAGTTALAIPGVGPVLLVAGGALAGAAAGGWLGSIGIGASNDVESQYNRLLSQGKYLMFVSTEDVAQDHHVRQVLNESGAQDLQAFPYAVNASDVQERPGAHPTADA